MESLLGRFFGAALLLFTVAGCAPREPHHRLQVVAADGSVLAALAIAPGGGWCLHWNHSVTGGPVADCYVNKGGRMILSHAFQHDFAAGLGHLPGRGTLLSQPGGGYRIDALNEPVPGNAYVLRVGSPAVHHRLVTETETLDLSALASGQRVTLRLAP